MTGEWAGLSVQWAQLVQKLCEDMEEPSGGPAGKPLSPGTEGKSPDGTGKGRVEQGGGGHLQGSDLRRTRSLQRTAGNAFRVLSKVVRRSDSILQVLFRLVEFG